MISDAIVSASGADLDAAMTWRDEPQATRRSLRAARAILAGLAKVGDEVGRAASWLTMDGHAVVRWFMRHAEEWFGPRDCVLDDLANKARYAILARRFGPASRFSPDERAVIEATDLGQRKIHQAGAELCVEGEACPGPMYIMSGWAARTRNLAGGRQQVVGLLLPGDGVCLHGGVDSCSPSTVTAITMVETVDAARLLRMAHAAEKYPGLARAMEREASLQESFSDSQILRLGALSNVERASHLMSELHRRLAEAGLADDEQFPMPLTLETLAEFLGMTVQEIRRTMRRLRSRRILSVRYGRARLLEQGRRGKFDDFSAPAATIVRRRGVPASA